MHLGNIHSFIISFFQLLFFLNLYDSNVLKNMLYNWLNGGGHMIKELDLFPCSTPAPITTLID